MNESEIKNLQTKLEITDAAAQAYVQKNGNFTLHDVARKAEMSVGEIFNYFRTKQEILDFFYTSLAIRYRLMIEEIDDFKSFTLSEKLSNFAYASFDLMQEREEFVQKTFKKMVLYRCKETEYERKIEDLLEEFFKNDPGKSASSDIFVNDAALQIMRRKYLSLVNFWLNDESEGREVTTELVDKLTGLIQELFYTSVVDRVVDLAKFVYSNNIIAKQFPLWKKITSSFEIR